MVVSLEEENPPPFANFSKGKAMAAQSEMGPEANTQRNGPSASAARRAAGARGQAADRHATRDQDAVAERAEADPCAARPRSTSSPSCPTSGSASSRSCYVGESQLPPAVPHLRTNSDAVYKQDFSSEVFFKSPPDCAGNICSPIATVFQSASFISALEELALQAEVVRARQLLVTQPMQRTQGNQNLDPANLFFDSESRAVQASATAEDDARRRGARDRRPR